MLIAKEKRGHNIAEYILYLWQLEDMLRALDFSPEKIFRMLVQPHEAMGLQEKQALLEWYVEMGDLLCSEGKRERGHLDHTMHLIRDLNDLHLHLLTAPVGKEYAALFTPLAPELPKLKAGMGGEAVSQQGRSSDSYSSMNDMEACFRALYSVMLCRLRGSATDEEAEGSGSDESKKKAEATEAYIKDVMDLVSPVVARLAAIHKAAEVGELDLYKDMA